jgi:exopolyphosphatase/guanosine-5'-triphosphate,3'-diphosphate pyrophosphatase
VDEPEPDSAPRAVIDIGSNTVRLVIYGPPLRAPVTLLNEKVTAKLGRDLATTGRLSEKGTVAALAALARFHTLLRMYKVPHAEVAATAAVRDASDGKEFLERVAAIGFAPRLLSGEEEAETSAAGVLAAFPGARGIVADLGGGSLELVDIDGTSPSHGVSLPFGTLLLPALRGDGTRPLVRTVRRALDNAHWSAEPGQTLYLVGGSLRSIARLVLDRARGPLDDPHGFTMSAAECERLTATLMLGPTERSEATRRISTSRLATMPDAAALLNVLIGKLNPREVVFSSWGLREGLLYRSLDPATRAQDPLIAGVSAFAEHLGATAIGAAMVAGWTAPAAPLGYRDDERLRLAATMLAMASMQVEPNLRAGHVIDWAMRKRLIGIDPRGRAMLGAALAAHVGDLTGPPGGDALAAPDDLAAARAWGLALRLCRRLTLCAPEALGNTGLSRNGDRLVLSLRAPAAVLAGDMAERDLKALANHLQLKGSVRIVDHYEPVA